MFLDTEVLVD